MKVRYKAIAVRHLRATEFYIAGHNPSAAIRVMERIDRAIQVLVEHPHAHRAGALPGSRELIISDFPYIVAYRVGPNFIDILGVFHAANHPSVRSRP